MNPRFVHGIAVATSFGLCSASVGAVDTNSLRAVKLAAGEIELTWQDTTPSAYCILRDSAQPPLASIAGTTTLSHTDIPPAGMPLWNYSVSESGACLTAACSAAAQLGCEAARLTGNNAAAGSSSSVSDYPGCAATGLSGPEFVYTFQATQDLDVDLQLSGLSADLDLAVLDDSGTCDPSRCVRQGDTGVSFRALAGSTYSVVVDGRAGASSDYTLDIVCSGTICTPGPTLACGALVSGNNGAGGTRVLGDYSPCALSGLTGPELAYGFVAAADGPVTLTLAGMTADLDLAVLADTGSGCVATECIAGGDTTVQFTATAGSTYYILVDGRNGAVSDYNLQASCGAAGCSPKASLVCGSPAVGRTDDPDSTDGVDRYSCSSADASGPEYTYVYTAAGTGDVTFRLSGSTSGVADVYVLAPATGCSGSSCIAWGDSEATVAVKPGETYWVVIDGPAPAGYNLSTVCNFPPGSCSPIQPLRCGDILFGDTRSGLATDVNDRYPCSPDDLSGPELTYEFAPPDRLGDYLVNLTLLPQLENLDLFVLQNQGSGCDPAGCVESGDGSLGFTALASDQYFVTIDGRNGVADGFQILVDCVPAPGNCRPASPARCGDRLLDQSNGAAGSTDVIDAYPTCPPIVFDETGPEFSYRFDAPASQNVHVELTNLRNGVAHLFVLEDTGAGCDVNSCVTKGTTAVDFAAVAGRTYYIVADGFNGAVATFDMGLTCN